MGEVTFLTNDHFMAEREKAKLLASGSITLTPEKLREMMQKAAQRFMGFQMTCLIQMTAKEAAVVRKYRVDWHLSWRDTAAVCYVHDAFDHWDKAGWSPPGNQLMGMALCERAAEMLGEKYEFPPWN